MEKWKIWEKVPHPEKLIAIAFPVLRNLRMKEQKSANLTYDELLLNFCWILEFYVNTGDKVNINRKKLSVLFQSLLDSSYFLFVFRFWKCWLWFRCVVLLGLCFYCKGYWNLFGAEISIFLQKLVRVEAH